MITANFIPVRTHIKERPQIFERFNVPWTPTQLVLDADGVERHRIEGFLPVEDFLAQLEVGLARLEFEHKQYAGAAKRFRAVCDGRPQTGVAPESCYWAGVSDYKATNDPKHLKATAELMKARYPESEWARKASVWAG